MNISNITIKDFRAFAHEQTFDLEGGKNLLLYGENGSGKSSLFQALREFFGAGSKKDYHAFENRFLHPSGSSNPHDGVIKVELSGTATPPPVNPMEWQYGGVRPVDDDSAPNAVAMSETMDDARGRSAFLDYRSLLRVSLGSDSPEERLFTLAIETLLADIAPATGGGVRNPSIRTLWKRVVDAADQFRSDEAREAMKKALDAFNVAVRAALLDVNSLTTDLLQEFEGSGLKIDVRMADVSYDWEPKLRKDRLFWNHRDQQGKRRLVMSIRVELNGVPIIDWPQFLNEARLSALALSMYLAGVRGSNAVTTDDVLRVLVLDDVLIGLDLSNRRPVLTILEKHFSDYQIFLLTHDRAWYDMASLAFADRGAWTRYELHRGRHLDFDIPVAHGKGATTAKNFTDRARHFLAPGTLDLRAAALYARVALEVKLKSYCDNKSIPTPYSMDGRSLDTEQLWKAVEGWLAGHGISGKSAFLMQEVKLYRRGVLNPMAHYHPVSLDQSEVEAAIKAVDALAFDPGNLDYLGKASQLLGSTAPSPHDIVDAACHLRTAFEVDLREFLKRMSGVVKYRTDWSSLGLLELWDAAKVIINPTNMTPAPALIIDIESERSLFLDDFDYATATSLSQAALQAAMNKLRDPAHHQPKTRLSTFV